MVRGEFAHPQWPTGRSRTPSSPSASKITSPRNVYTDAEPRKDLHFFNSDLNPSQLSLIPRKPVTLSLMPPNVQQNLARPRHAPLPLLDAAAALRYQTGAGMTLGSSRYNPYSGATASSANNMNSAPFSAVPNSFSSTPFSPISSPEEVDDSAHSKSAKWKMLGGFFHKKPISTQNEPNSAEEAPASLPSQSASVIPPPLKRPDGPVHRRQKSRSMELPRVAAHAGIERPKDVPTRVQKPRTLVKSPSLRRPPPIPGAVPSRPSPTRSLDKPMPPTPHGEHERRPAVPPKLQVDIPDFQMERYSVMFGNVLNARQSTLMVRRQAQLERLKLSEANEGLAQNEPLLDKAVPELPKEEDEGNPKSDSKSKNILAVPHVRRATLPSPTKSPAYSLFPPPSIRGASPAPKSGSPKPLQRSWTSPALSPGLDSPNAKSKVLEAANPRVGEKLSSRPAEKTREISGPKVPAKTDKPMSRAFEPSVESPRRQLDASHPPLEVAKAVAKVTEKPVVKLVVKTTAISPAQEKAMEKPVPPTISEECEDPCEYSPVADSPPTPKSYGWEPRISPRPNRSTSLGESESDPRERSGDIIIQIAAEPTGYSFGFSNSPPIPEPRKGTIELLGTPVYEMPPPLPRAKPAPPITPLGDLTGEAEKSPLPTKWAVDPATLIDNTRPSLNKPLPVPSTESPLPSAEISKGTLSFQRSDSDEVDWHVVSPRKASLLAQTTQNRPRKDSLNAPTTIVTDRPNLTPISTESARKTVSPSLQQDSRADSPRAPRRPSLATKPGGRTDRGLPPKTTIGRDSAAAMASMTESLTQAITTSASSAHRPSTAGTTPTSATPTSASATSHSSVTSPASTGPMPNPLASAPTSATEISIARQISITRRQRQMVPIVAKQVRPPQHAQLVVPPDQPLSPSDVNVAQQRLITRKSHHIQLEIA